MRRRRKRRSRKRGRRRTERHGHGILAKKARTGHSRARPNVSGDRPTDRAAFRFSASHFTLHPVALLAAYLYEAATSRASARFKGTEAEVGFVSPRFVMMAAATRPCNRHVRLPLFRSFARARIRSTGNFSKEPQDVAPCFCEPRIATIATSTFFVIRPSSYTSQTVGE